MDDETISRWTIAIIIMLTVFALYAAVTYIPRIIKEAMAPEVETYVPAEPQKVEWEAISGQDKG